MNFVGILGNEGKKFRGGSAVRAFLNNEGSNIDDQSDIFVIEYDAQKYKADFLSNNFLELNEKHVWPFCSCDAPFIVYGLPSSLQDIDYNENFIRIKMIQTNAYYDSPSNSPYLHRARFERTGTFDCDGMSGGPVFYLGRNHSEFFIGLAGMILRGGGASDFFYFMEAKFLVQLAMAKAIVEMP